MAFTMEEVEAVADGHLAGQTIGQLRQLGILTLAILHAPGDYEPNPPDERAVAPGEHLIVSGASDVLDSLARSSFSDSRSWQPVVKRA
jgi:K+/H+ antiporter YhaU regulatory subunit KhtT